MIREATVLLFLGIIQLGYGQMYDPRCKEMGWRHWRTMGFSRDGSCFLVGGMKASFVDALSWCERLDGAHLAEVPNMISNRLLMANVQRQVPGIQRKYWIGLTDVESEGFFKWVGKKQMAFPFNNFAPGQTANNDVTKNCVLIDGKGQWYVDSCKAEHYFICEK